MTRPALTVDQVASRLAVSRGAIYAAVQRGEIPCIRIGRAVRIPAAATPAFAALKTHVETTALAMTNGEAIDAIAAASVSIASSLVLALVTASHTQGLLTRCEAEAALNMLARRIAASARESAPLNRRKLHSLCADNGEGGAE